jgi:hypothetical protein
MRTEVANRWLTLGANIAVLIGIAFLYAELHQNSKLARMQLVADRRANFQQIEVGFFGENAAETWEKSILDPSSLSFAELRTMDAYLTIELNRMLSILELEQDGLLDAGTTEQQMRLNFPYYFGNDFAKSYWATQESLWPDDFVQLAGSIIEGVDANFTRSLFERMHQPTSTDELAEAGH